MLHTWYPYFSQGAVTYQLPSADVSWSSLFRQLESNKERLGIIDYSVSQTTLEQVRTHQLFNIRSTMVQFGYVYCIITL